MEAESSMAKLAPFDEHVEEYDAWFERHRESYLAELVAVRELLPSGGTGVEIGIGSGRFAGPLGIPFGVEPSPRMAELARRRGLRVLEATAEALPFADGEFDFALMVTVICFLDDVEQALREAHRILRPGGVLVIGFIDRESALGREYSRKKDRSMFYRDAVFYSAHDVEGMLSRSGFSGFSYRQTLFADPVRRTNVDEDHGEGGFVVVRAFKR
jgi:SAM-dependent methyltransferase